MNNEEKFQIVPCYLVTDLSEATGGICYDRQALGEGPKGVSGEYKRFETLKTTDHVAIVKEGNALYQRARNAVRRRASHTPLGYICNEAELTHIRLDFADLGKDAIDYNRRSIALGSSHRVRCAIVALKIEIDNAAAAIEIHRTIETVLDEIIDLLVARDAKKLAGLLDTKAKNLHLLVIGLLRVTMIDALDAARAARSAIRKAGDAAASLDLSETIAAIHVAKDCLVMIE